jgi:hypothetical protein
MIGFMRSGTLRSIGLMRLRSNSDVRLGPHEGAMRRIALQSNVGDN